MTAAPLLLDDHLLLRQLLDDPPRSLARRRGPRHTTGLWYHRLCRAVLTSPVLGTMSSRLAGAPPELAVLATRAAVDLPADLGLVSLRDLAWPMAELLQAGARLKLSSLEALAAAEHLGATICLADVDANRPLMAAAGARGVRFLLVTD